MLKEVITYLDPSLGQKFIDGTLGGAGYTLAISELIGKSGKILSVDLDQLAIEKAKAEIDSRKLKNIVLVQNNFRNLKKIVEEIFPKNYRFNGLVLDLGLSSAQLDDEERGFSFKGNRPLDMAFGPENRRSTEEIINNYSLLELTRIFREYGEESRAYQIAKGIVAFRRNKKIKTTAELVEIVDKMSPRRFHSKINPATKVFQALRIETNDELSALSEVLSDAVELLMPGGRIVVVSFHSGEDRIVKRFFKGNADLEILTKRPLIPSEDESLDNPRARSAKLRAARKK